MKNGKQCGNIKEEDQGVIGKHRKKKRNSYFEIDRIWKC